MLDPKRFGLACGIMWGVMLFIITLVASFSGYWQGTVALVSDVYLGTVSASLFGAVAGLIVGFIDGIIGGYIFAALYNWLENKV